MLLKSPHPSEPALDIILSYPGGAFPLTTDHWPLTTAYDRQRNPPAVHRLLRARSTATRSCRRRRVVPHDDPTLLFTNAGMNQFKAVFLGTEHAGRTSGRPTRRSASAPAASTTTSTTSARTPTTTPSSRCSATGRFGDYFKKEAIAWAWELLTEVWKLDKTPAARHRLRRRPGRTACRATTRRRSCWTTRTDIDPIAHPSAATRRTTSGRWARPARAARAPRSTSTARRTRRGGKLVNKGDAGRHRDLEPRVHPVQPQRGQQADAAAGEARRYRHGLRARSRRCCRARTSNYDTDVFTPIFDGDSEGDRSADVHAASSTT